MPEWRPPTEDAVARSLAEALSARGFARDRTENARLYRSLGLAKGMTHDAADA